MRIRPFQPQDASALARLASTCARGENDFVLNPLWESEEELFADFRRHGGDPEEDVIVADLDEGEPIGLSGFLRVPGSTAAALLCPIVARNQRGHGAGGELLRAALREGAEKHGIKLVTAAIGTRNRSGYSLLTALGFRPVRQHFLMRCDEKPAQGKAPDGCELGVAAARDAEAILEIYHVCGFEARTLEQMKSVMSDGRHSHAVARRNGRVVAFAELETHWSSRVWVAFVGVASDNRDRGLGTALCAWAVAECFDSGSECGLLMLSPANRTALRAYEKVGFRRHRLVDVLERGL